MNFMVKLVDCICTDVGKKAETMDRDKRGRKIKRSKKINSDETGSSEFHSEIGGFPLPVAQSIEDVFQHINHNCSRECNQY